jgi:tyrosyl-tRNA synthetase
MKIITDEKKIKELLSRNVEEVIIKDNLEQKLKSGKQLRVKLGADPSRPDLHLGHSVVLNKLREFQDLGHAVVFIIGDFTAKIGDPSEKSKMRPRLSDDEIKANAETYLKQVGKFLDVKRAEVHYNSEWFSKGGWTEVLEITGKFTIARILERDDFTKRLKNRTDIGVHEILYPIMQAYDSVEVAADVEIGGTDQKFNMLTGRDLQRKLNLSEQDIITCPLLVGLDGKEKMSKSLDNYIAILDSAEEMYGKIMSMPDELIMNYFKLLTKLDEAEIKNIEKSLRAGANPRDLKMQLGREIVTRYNNQKAAQEAEEEFIKVFQRKEKPEEMPEIKSSGHDIITVLIDSKLAKSKSDARRLIEQGGVKINDEKVGSIGAKVKEGDVVQKGRFFIKVI